MPTQAMAEAVAEEWRAQEETVDPLSMPVTRAVNAALDKVTPRFAEVAEMLAAYGDSDLTCYRADGPEALIARQKQVWDPLLDWASDTYQARLLPVEGVMHQAQDDAALARLAAPLSAMTPFELTAAHDLVSLSGSLVIGLAACAQARPIEELWQASRVDETWQAEQWGEDEEAAEVAALKQQAFYQADAFYRMSRNVN
jgi:chaperone required for assembly of F1-ATPase